VAGDKVTYHIEIASMQNWAKTEQVRTVKFEGNRMTTRTQLLPRGGVMQVAEIVWERVKWR
jgi:hypothetical protein